MLNNTTDLKSAGRPEYTDAVTSTSLQNKDGAPTHLAVSASSPTLHKEHQTAIKSSEGAEKGEATAREPRVFQSCWRR